MPHSCGNLTEIMKDLIEDVGIDALHSFEDGCYSVMQYKKKYGDRIGILGLTCPPRIGPVIMLD